MLKANLNFLIKQVPSWDNHTSLHVRFDSVSVHMATNKSSKVNVNCYVSYVIVSLELNVKQQELRTRKHPNWCHVIF